MRPIPFLIALACVMAITVVSYELWRSKFDRPSTPPDVGKAERVAPREEEKKRGAPKRTIETKELDRIRRAIVRWQFAPEDRDLLVQSQSDSSARRLLDEWNLRTFVRAHIEASVPSRVEEYTRVVFENGRVLWALEARREERGLNVRTAEGIRATFPLLGIDKTEIVDRATYLQETRTEFEKAIRETPDHPRTIFAALEKAHQREAWVTVEKLYARWCELEGPERLARSLSREKADRLRLFANAVAAGKPKRPTPPPRTVTKTETKASAPRAEKVADDEPSARAPRTAEDLQRKLRGLQRRLSPRLSEARREKLLADLNSWEDWLERSATNQAIEHDRAQELRRQIQFIRLDLLKLAGF